jgi:hypothetical protein
MLAASRRLVSSFAALPFGLIQTFIGWVGRPLKGSKRLNEFFEAKALTMLVKANEKKTL